MQPQRQPMIGLAGGIGSGKSTVAKMLAELGCVVYDSDAGGRAALRDPAIRNELVAWWGPGILNDQGEVDRSKVASIIFNDPAQRKRLENLTHPWIERERREVFAKAPPEAPALVIDAPLLFEAGLDSQCDAVIFVEADPAVRLARVQVTRGWTAQELAKREHSQMPLDRKRSRADDIVQNNGDLSGLKAQVRRALQNIVQSSRK